MAIVSGALRCQARITIPTFNAEFAPEQDGGQCKDAAVAVVVTEHGDNCECQGLCLIELDTNRPIEPWTERLHLCQWHLDEYGEPRAAETITRL